MRLAGLYAEHRGRMLGQLAADLFMIVWIGVWALVGLATERTVDAVATPLRTTRDRAGQLADQVRQAAEQAGQLPGVGGELRKPFDGTADQVQGLIGSVELQITAIDRAAALLGWLVFAIPVVILLVIWLPARVRFVRRARAAQRFVDGPADLDLFALRAMTTQPMHVIAKISDDPVAAWRHGDQAVIDALAAVELRRSGLRPPG
jgi:hypothetical protein